MTTKRKSETDLKGEIKANAGKVWLAGLGAMATAEEEGGKILRGLMKKGESYEKKGLAHFEKFKTKVEDAAGAAKDRAGEAWEKVEEKVDDVEGRWDDRVLAMLRKIGVPSKSEIAALTRRVEELTVLVEKKLKPARPAAKRTASAKASTKGKTRTKSRATTTRRKG